MKSRQLLSIVFSLIMVTGVSAGSAAYAQSDDLEEIEDIIEDFCELDDSAKQEFFSEYPDYAKYDERLATICDIEDKDEREAALDELTDEAIPNARDENDDNETEDDSEDETETEMEDNDKRHEDLDDRLERFCEMSDDEKAALFADHPRISEFKDKLTEFCQIEDEDQREDAIDEFIDEFVPGTHDEIEYSDKYSNEGKGNLHEHLAMMCEMSDDDKSKFMEMVSDLPEDIREKLADFCDMTKDEQRNLLDSIRERMDEFKKEHMMIVREMQEKFDDIREHKVEYERFCSMSDSELAAATFDADFIDKASKWCDMTPEERDAYKKEHHDAAMDSKEKRHDALERMKENKELSHRLKAMVLDDDSDDKISELKEKIRERSQEHDKKKLELKEKFRENKSDLKFRFSEMSDIRKSDIKERLKEMKEFKNEIRLKSDSLTDEEKQELRAEFIEKAKDMQLAWITPRDQISAGIEPDQIECREGYTLVMKNSNGLPMCVKAKSAIKMIEKGYAVPVEPAN